MDVCKFCNQWIAGDKVELNGGFYHKHTCYRIHEKQRRRVESERMRQLELDLEGENFGDDV